MRKEINSPTTSMPVGAGASKIDKKKYRHRCFSPSCKKYAWLIDWAGWQWCFKHWHYQWKWGGGRKWYELRTVRIIKP